MTYQDFQVLIDSIGLPTAYYQFRDDTATSPPFICWFFVESSDFYADNTNYQRVRPARIELYTDYKDFDLENRIEALLNAAGIPFTRSEGSIDRERMYMVTFAVTPVITLEGEIENA